MALFDLSSEVNAIYSTFAKKLGFLIKPIDIGAEKIDGIMLDNYEMVITAFLVINKVNWVRFFEKTFLVTNVSLKVVFKMFFFNLSNADVDFLD